MIQQVEREKARRISWDAVMVNITVRGLGYVGSVSAACLAKLGHAVAGIDMGSNKVQCLQEARARVYELGLDDLIAEVVKLGRLKAGTEPADHIQNTDICIICVGTPSTAEANWDLTYLRRVMGEIAAFISNRSQRLIISIRSTVLAGVNEQIYNEVLRCDTRVVMISNPELCAKVAP